MSICSLIHSSPLSRPMGARYCRRLALLSILAAGLAACGSQPQLNDPAAATEIIQTGPGQLSAQDYLDRASRVEGSEKIPLLLSAVHALLEENNPEAAGQVLADLELTDAEQQHLQHFHLLQAAVSVHQQHWHMALQSLQFPGTRQLNPAFWHRISAKAQAGLGNRLAAVNDLHLCAGLPVQRLTEDCNNLRWHALMQLETGQLERLDSDPHLRGWADLALILQQSSGPIESQMTALEQWLNQHTDLAETLPDEAALLLTQRLNIPQRIALVLPLSGRLAEAGLAILDGVMAARFELLEQGLSTPLLDVYDSASETAESLALKLTPQTYDLVLGPLDPQQVQQLADRLDPNLPMLAFNRLEQPGEAAHFGMSLAVETEAAQAAQALLQQGMQRALVLVQDSTYGERAASAFSATLQQQPRSSLAGLIRVNDPTALTRSLEQAFHLDQSEQRRQQLQSLLGKRLEFSPRRRDDIELIFLASNAGLARQVAPTLAFVFAETIPVLATSAVFDGRVGAEENRDLGRINFLVAGWELERQSPLGVETNRGAELARLEALGYDTFFVGRRLGYLQQSQGSYAGLLAQWRLETDKNFARTMGWARIDGEGIRRSDWNR